MLDATKSVEEGYIQEIIKIFPNVFLHRYLTAFAVSVSLWDHCVTLDEEYRAVWTNREEKFMWPLAYVIFRYGTDAIMVMIAYVQGGTIEVNTRWYTQIDVQLWFFMIFGFLFVGFTQALVAHRIHSLWEHRRFIRYIVYIVFAVFMISSAIFLVLGGVEYARNIRAEAPPIRSCMNTTKAPFTTWGMGIMSAFNMFLVLMGIINALDMPRTRNAEVLGRLNREGAKSFLGLFGEELYLSLRGLVRFLVNQTHSALLFVSLCLIIWGNISISYIFLSPGWALSSIITSRLFCRVSITKQETALPQTVEMELRTMGFVDSEKRSCSSSQGSESISVVLGVPVASIAMNSFSEHIPKARLSCQVYLMHRLADPGSSSRQQQVHQVSLLLLDLAELTII
ncbi:hypothetical protein NP233_g8793 [Leucocoprinus birnbaumii]|uniref:DUF6533 domain-containing protein n=1 Tax=Leucocoprinus birnbaumii TaxID=56174 RepID=A0AAD5VQ53_9AGAR|nr:hypothetical protein NP233_g8793 [Leucocoprinus birnbaumii]